MKNLWSVCSVVIAVLLTGLLLHAQTSCPPITGEIINGSVKTIASTTTAAQLSARAAQLIAAGWTVLGIGGSASNPTILASCPVSTTPPIPPSGTGISSRYPKDVGIATDPAVVFNEEFEDSIAAVGSRWTTHVERTSYISQDVHPDSVPGSHSIAIPHVLGDEGGQFFKGFSQNRDELYVRYYIKPQLKSHHSGVWIGGENVGSGGPQWPDPHAGSKPCRVSNGECTTRQLAAWFWTSAEPDSTNYMNTYSAFLNMHPDTGGTYWGNLLATNQSTTIPINTWTCVEHRVKMNRVGDTDGEYSIWINNALFVALKRGAPLGSWTSGIFTPASIGTPFEGLEWRDTIAYGVNYVWLQNYADASQPPYTVWYDHVVVATQYIGCMS